MPKIDKNDPAVLALVEKEVKASVKVETKRITEIVNAELVSLVETVKETDKASAKAIKAKLAEIKSQIKAA